jgi:threonine/homoserine/homoserine lactone efflux protein
LIANVAFIFLTALVVGYSGALVPGPMFTLVIAESAKHGRWSGLLVTSGHVVLEALVLVGLAVGLNRVLAVSWVTSFISVAGGAVMLTMGVVTAVRAARGMLVSWPEEGYRTEAGAGVQSADGSHNRRRGVKQAALGALVSLSNPYFLLWWATIGSAYFVSAAVFGISGVIAFFVGHILADITWYGILGHMTAYGRRFVRPRVYRGVVVACGVALAGLAVYFMFRGIAGA